MVMTLSSHKLLFLAYSVVFYKKEIVNGLAQGRDFFKFSTQ